MTDRIVPQCSVCAVRVLIDQDPTQEFIECAVVRLADSSICTPDRDGTGAPIDRDDLPADVANLAAADCGESRWMLAEGDGITQTLWRGRGIRLRPVSTVDGTVTVNVRCQVDSNENYDAALLVNGERIVEGSERSYSLAQGDELLIVNDAPSLVVPIDEPMVIPQPPPLTPAVAAGFVRRHLRTLVQSHVSDEQRANATAFVAARTAQQQAGVTISEQDAAMVAVLIDVAAWVQAMREKGGELLVLSESQPEDVIAAAATADTWPAWSDAWTPILERMK